MKLTTETINLPARYSIPAESTAIRDALLLECQSITSITDAASLARAVKCGINLQAHLKEVEEARVALTTPLLEAQRKLMDLKNAHCDPLLLAKSKLAQMVSEWNMKEKARIAEEKRVRDAEIARLEQERAEAKRAMEQSALEASKSDDVAADLKAHAATQVFEQSEQASLTAMMTPINAVKAKGAATGMRLCFEVLDAHEVYKARPDLCELTVKKSAVQSTLTVNSKVPGLRLWEEPKTSFRS